MPGKWPDQTLDHAFGLSEVLAAVSTLCLSCKTAGKTRTLMHGLGFIWRISVQKHYFVSLAQDYAWTPLL